MLLLSCGNVAVFCRRILLWYCPADSAMVLSCGNAAVCILPQDSAMVLSCGNIAAFCRRILLWDCYDILDTSLRV
nr:hypothetical protein CFP56_37913 [Quercus suber]